MEVNILKADLDRAAHFKCFIQKLVERFQPTRIFSFGTHTVHQEIEGPFAHKDSKHRHYCLLICTESCTRIDYEVQEFANAHYYNGHVTILCHGELTIKERIEANSRFFTSVISNGKLIYTKEGYVDAEFNAKYNPVKTLEKAERHLFNRISLATGFLKSAEESLVRGQHNIATFLLHQAVEQSCSLLIRVHIDYRSEFHNLNRLLGLTRCFSDEPTNLMIGDRTSGRRLFDILIKSYGQARYAPEFFVAKKDAGELYDKVSAFIELTKNMCASKMRALEQEVDEYKLHTENQ
jgi:HEPN domain-containing protein